MVGDQYLDIEAEDDQEQRQQHQQQPAAAPSSSKQRKQQQARQETLQMKADKGQTTLTFMAYDRAVLAQFPQFVQQQVPFMTTAKGAVDRGLLDFITSLATSNVGFANITSRLQEQAHTQHYRQQLTYVSYAKEAEAAAVVARGEGRWGGHVDAAQPQQYCIACAVQGVTVPLCPAVAASFGSG